MASSRSRVCCCPCFGGRDVFTSLVRRQASEDLSMTDGGAKDENALCCQSGGYPSRFPPLPVQAPDGRKLKAFVQRHARRKSPGRNGGTLHRHDGEELSRLLSGHPLRRRRGRHTQTRKLT